MASKNSDDKEIRCSFCGKTQEQVKKLIAGPSGVYICDECVDICADIIDEEEDDDIITDDMEINLLKPVEIKEFLDEYVIITRELRLPKMMTMMWSFRRATSS